MSGDVRRGIARARPPGAAATVCKCQRCGHQWRTLDEASPARCAKCTASASWSIRRTDVRRTREGTAPGAVDRRTLELLIGTAGWQPETFTSAQALLPRPRATVPCCLVLDMSLPGLSGLELQQQLEERTDMPTIFITGHGDVPTTVQAMKAGAVEFLTTPFKDSVLLDAIRGAIEHSRAALLRDSETRALRHCYQSLTPRQRDVMALVVSGLLTSRSLQNSGSVRSPVKVHRGQVMRKMRAGSLPDLVTMARASATRLRRAPDGVGPRDPRNGSGLLRTCTNRGLRHEHALLGPSEAAACAQGTIGVDGASSSRRSSGSGQTRF